MLKPLADQCEFFARKKTMVIASEHRTCSEWRWQMLYCVLILTKTYLSLFELLVFVSIFVLNRVRHRIRGNHSGSNAIRSIGSSLISFEPIRLSVKMLHNASAFFIGILNNSITVEHIINCRHVSFIEITIFAENYKLRLTYTLNF